jgi:hypothetical protein
MACGAAVYYGLKSGIFIKVERSNEEISRCAAIGCIALVSISRI